MTRGARPDASDELQYWRGVLADVDRQAARLLDESGEQDPQSGVEG
jgi:hypothetical protein